MKKFFQKLLSVLQVRSMVAGLEVGDQVLRLVYFGKKVWQMNAIRLEPGILEGGKIKNREAFVAALAALKAKVQGIGKTRKMNVVVCLSSVETYTQMFALPTVQGESLEKAVGLNLQMASPFEANETYSGWQLVGRDEKTLQLQILSAFIERRTVDGIVDALFEAGFLAMAVESKALALTRMLREKGAGMDTGKSCVFVNVDDSGLDFLIIRNGALYFEYGNPWRDMVDKKGEITVAKFEETLAASVRRVMNFYNQHWPDTLETIVLSAVALEAQAEKVIAENTSVPSARLTLVMGQPISSEWLTALGCSLRGAGLVTKAREISFLGEDSQDRFLEEQFLHFMRFWRVVVPTALGLLVLAFFVADLLLVSTKKDIEARSDFNLGSAQNSEIATLQTSAGNFNRSVLLAAAAENATSPKSTLLTQIMGMAAASHITVNHLSFQSFSTPISLLGTAQAEDAIVAFKTALQSNSAFSAINFPLTEIQANGRVVSFSATFIYTPPPSASK